MKRPSARSKGIDNKPANYTVWYATHVATLVVQTRATSPVGASRLGGVVWALQWTHHAVCFIRVYEGPWASEM